MKHKIIRIMIIGCLMISSLLIGGAALAQDKDLPDPGITPDSPFYFFDTMGKNIGMAFTFGAEAKARKALRYAEERLAEASEMATQNRTREMTQATDGYESFMAMVNERVTEMARLGNSDNVSERVALAASRHFEILERVRSRVSGQATEALTRAREASMNGQENALRALAKDRPERALEISSDAIQGLLARVRVRAAEVATDNLSTDNTTTDNATSGVAEALGYAARIAALEEEITAIAEENGFDGTHLTQRLAQSTSNRLQVLAGVYEEAPEQARPAIENAIENSVRKYERAVVKLRGKNALGEIPEEAPMLQRVQEEVRERVGVNGSDNGTGPVRAENEVQERVGEQLYRQADASDTSSSNNGTELNRDASAQGQGQEKQTGR